MIRMSCQFLEWGKNRIILLKLEHLSSRYCFFSQLNWNISCLCLIKWLWFVITKSISYPRRNDTITWFVVDLEPAYCCTVCRESCVAVWDFFSFFSHYFWSLWAYSSFLLVGSMALKSFMSGKDWKLTMLLPSAVRQVIFLKVWMNVNSLIQVLRCSFLGFSVCSLLAQSLILGLIALASFIFLSSFSSFLLVYLSSSFGSMSICYKTLFNIFLRNEIEKFLSACFLQLMQ